MDLNEGMPKIGVGDMVSVSHFFNNDHFIFNGEVRRVETNKNGKPVLVVSDGTNTEHFDLVTIWVTHVALIRKAGIEQFVPPRLDDDWADRIARKVHTPSYYTVSFTLKYGNATIATVSGKRYGKITPPELIRLAILKNYRQLSYFDGSWYSVSPLKKILEFYVKDGLPMPTRDFGVDGISISGYNAKTGEFYEVPVPSPKLLLVENLDGAYEVYIKQWNHMVP